ncbi:hypothetical protein AMTR_s00041p00118950 [Amborella trichopoda]|uniref:Uncharacterized protein n=1 Tax=Amborella trichopoda TaxID=13333 RepID=W1PZ00_AMBTC|nr:hypothetical protein AMTR_s00041p00118950 [Amborella trichopoda]
MGTAREGQAAKGRSNPKPVFPNCPHVQLCILRPPWLPLPNAHLSLMVGLDWSAISSYLGSPLASPWFAIANIGAGFFLVMYVIAPICYWFDMFHAKRFPIFSEDLFKFSGQQYDILSIINNKFNIDLDAYKRNGPLYLSTFFAVTYGVGFASLTATVVHVMPFHGREIWQLSKSAFQKETMDIHTKLMSKYKQVPEWWFFIILAIHIVLTIFACEYYKEQLQLPWWGVLLSCGLAFFFTLPVGIIAATTNQASGLNIITEYIIGYMYQGRPVANVCFKVYEYISMLQALTFLQDFKLGHYMKKPPRTMFVAQVVGTLIASFVYLGTAWWLMNSIPHICDRKLLPHDSPWTCPMDRVFYDASVIWGLIGPLNWFFLVGAIAPVLVWLLHKAYPTKTWIRLINMPVLIGATGMMPPATAVNYTTYVFVGFLFSVVLYRYYRGWWARHNYVLSGAFDAGLAFMGVLLYLSLGLENVSFKWWGSELHGCPLATCPTAKGVHVQGCPVF